MDSRPQEPLPPDRITVVWSGKWIILLVAVLMCAVATLGAQRRSVSYTTQAKIAVNLLQTKGIGEQNALAANELAAQYAQLATTRPVLQAAQKALGSDAAGLSSAISATAINNYNLIGISATSASSDRAAKQAAAVAAALRDYVRQSNQDQIDSANEAGAARENALDTQIASLQKQIAADLKTASSSDPAIAATAQSALAGERSLLGSLTSDRETIFTATQRDLIASQPSLSLVDAPSSAPAKSRHVPLYALIGLLVGALVSAELLVIISRARFRLRTPSAQWPPADLRDMSRL